MSLIIKNNLSAKIVVCTNTIKALLYKINKIQNDFQTNSNEKLSQIKKIREEMSKVGTEIDMIKKEITLLNGYNVN